jgi:hypothetical protein
VDALVVSEALSFRLPMTYPFPLKVAGTSALLNSGPSTKRFLVFASYRASGDWYVVHSVTVTLGEQFPRV